MPIHFFRAPRLTATIASILLTAFAIAAHAQSSNATLSPIMYFYLSSPNGNVVADNDGNLYGATTAGAPTGAGSGLLYMLPKDGASSVKTIYQFGAPGTVADGGAFPGAGLLLIDNDTLYGVASATASDPQRPPPTGTGTIYKISTSGQNFTKLYEFEPLTIDSRHFLINNSGAGPRAPLIEGKEGGVSFLYGTAFQGGPDGTGTVFKFRTDGTGGLIVLGSFGAVPQHQRVDADGNPVLDSNGNPILDLDTNIDSQLVNPNGVNPDHRLLLGGDGYLYGTTQFGGVNGTGVVFRVSVSGGGIEVLKTFDASPPVITDTADPNFGKPRTNVSGAYATGGLVRAIDGNLYGTTSAYGGNGVGAAFGLAADGSNFNAFFAFSTDTCSTPSGQLIVDVNNMLIGTCTGGGTVPPDRITATTPTLTAAGNIFQMSLDGAIFNQLYVFTTEESATKGTSPSAGVIAVSDTNGTALYGIAGGGTTSAGLIFKYGDATNRDAQGTPSLTNSYGSTEWWMTLALVSMAALRSRSLRKKFAPTSR